MGKLDDLKNKAKEMVSENREKIEGGLEKAGEVVNQKTGGKYEEKIDKGLAKAQEGLDRVEGGAGTADEGQAPMSEGHGAPPEGGPGLPEGTPGVSEGGKAIPGS